MPVVDKVLPRISNHLLPLEQKASIKKRVNTATRQSTTRFTVESMGLPPQYRGVERGGRANPVGCSEVSKVGHLRRLAAQVMVAALNMTLNPPRENEPGPGGFDPASGVS